MRRAASTGPRAWHGCPRCGAARPPAGCGVGRHAAARQRGPPVQRGRGTGTAARPPRPPAGAAPAPLTPPPPPPHTHPTPPPHTPAAAAAGRRLPLRRRAARRALRDARRCARQPGGRDRRADNRRRPRRGRPRARRPPTAARAGPQPDDPHAARQRRRAAADARLWLPAGPGGAAGGRAGSGGAWGEGSPGEGHRRGAGRAPPRPSCLHPHRSCWRRV
jgi:ribonuclease E